MPGDRTNFADDVTNDVTNESVPEPTFNSFVDPVPEEEIDLTSTPAP